MTGLCSKADCNKHPLKVPCTVEACLCIRVLLFTVNFLSYLSGSLVIIMGRAKKTKKFATMKRMISASDPRLKDKDRAPPKKKKSEDPHEIKTTEAPQTSSALFFQYNTALGPPFHILLDTNFINFSIKNKMDVMQSMMDTLYAKCTPYITDCVMGELEKLGAKYRVALRIVKDPRFVRLPCMHKGTYADDCLGMYSVYYYIIK